MIVSEKNGGRTVHLYLPFEYMGRRIESVTLSPLKFGHTLLWNEGHYKTMLELLIDLAGVEEAIIRDLRYPDADRVMETFTMMLTPQIREDIGNGIVPQKPPGIQQQEQPPPVTNGGGHPMMPQQGPGEPLPFDSQPGFDMSEEP